MNDLQKKINRWCLNYIRTHFKDWAAPNPKVDFQIITNYDAGWQTDWTLEPTSVEIQLRQGERTWPYKCVEDGKPFSFNDLLLEIFAS